MGLGRWAGVDQISPRTFWTGPNIEDILPWTKCPAREMTMGTDDWGQGERKMPIEVNSEQLRFHHMGTDLRKDFNRINNLGLRNLDAEPVKSRSLENSDRKRAAFGKETCKLKSNAAAGQLLSNFK